jgi:hypothetical protein
LAAPLAATWFAGNGRRLKRVYVIVAVALTAATGLASALFRTAAPLISVRYGGTAYRSIVSGDRADQLARNRREDAPAIRAMEAAIPPTATVALALPPESFEYPFFGPRLQRTVRPVGRNGSIELAPGEFFVFSDALRTPRPGDVHLGADWWLRSAGTPTRD